MNPADLAELVFERRRLGPDLFYLLSNWDEKLVEAFFDELMRRCEKKGLPKEEACFDILRSTNRHAGCLSKRMTFLSAVDLDMLHRKHPRRSELLASLCGGQRLAEEAETQVQS